MAANRPSRRNKRQVERWLALGTLALIAIVWAFGALRAQADLMPAIQQALEGPMAPSAL